MTTSVIEASSGTYRSRVDEALYQRLLGKMRQADSGCWEWTACRTPNGYGKLQLDGKPVGAHRAMWRALHGSLPTAIYVCHRCDNKRCINPGHLFAGTAKDNAQDRAAKGRSFRGVGELNANSLYSDAQVRHAVERIAAGERRTDVSRELGMSVAAVGLWMRRFGVKVGTKGQHNGRAKIKDSDLPAIRARLAAGESKLSIGRAYGVSGHPIWRIAKGARA